MFIPYYALQYAFEGSKRDNSGLQNAPFKSCIYGSRADLPDL